MPTEGCAVELEVDERSQRRTTAGLVVAEVERHTAGGGATADREVELGAAPGEVGALDPKDVGVGDRRRGAVDVDRGGGAVERLDAGGVAPHLVHGEAPREVDAVGDLGIHLQTQAVGVEDVVVVVVALGVGVGEELSHELLLHLGRERRHHVLQPVKGDHVVDVVEVVGVVLCDEALHVFGRLRRHAGGAEVKQGVDQHPLKLHAVVKVVVGRVDGVQLEAEVAREVDLVERRLALVLHDAFFEVGDFFLEFVDLFLGRRILGERDGSQAEQRDAEHRQGLAKHLSPP